MKIPLFHWFPMVPNRFLFLVFSIFAQLAYGGISSGETGLEDSARPWTFWYWMESAVTREGIRADLEAMSEAGLGGAYLMPIKGKADPPHTPVPVEQLSPLFWEMVTYAMEVADAHGIKLAMHACDGFAVAGGPWVTPAQSMQQLVWTRSDIEGGGTVKATLPKPLVREGYYRDIAVYAFPALKEGSRSSADPEVSAVAEDGTDLTRLLDRSNASRYRADQPGHIEIRFPEVIQCRSIRIQPEGNNFQAMRLVLLASMDGVVFESVQQLEPPRHGWQDSGPLSWSIPETTGRVFRLAFDPAGSEPGAEDLDFAKWRAVLKVLHIELSEEPVLAQFEGKSGAVWRIAPAVDATLLPEEDCIPMESIQCLEGQLTPAGELEMDLPPGSWTLLRVGHTSTGKTNYIGGNGKGLEIDKFSEDAARLQFDNWFGEAIKQAGPALAGRVLKVFHVDSWECGSQNWSSTFRQDFARLRGYDPLVYLPLVAGFPIENAAVSEQFLLDMRRTLSELVNERFFGTLHRLAREAGCLFSAESVAPTMTADALRHFGTVDLPMGEFWLRSPTHDKPTDILDAISGGHIYGKRIIQAEAFTQLRMAWDEHPGMLKALGDRHLAAGINRFVFHVFAHNPWLEKIPGMTLSGVGLYFQRDQTWWPAVRAWMDYLHICQDWLQRGVPVTDIAVFTGEDIPSRSLLPEDLVTVLPGLIGERRIELEKERLQNTHQPLRELPMGVRASANIRNPLDWINPLNGYAYDSINRDALLRLAKAEKGDLVLPGGSRYQLLVVPANRRNAPNASVFSLDVLEKLIQLMESGVPILFENLPTLRMELGGTYSSLAATEVLQRLYGLIEENGGVGPWKATDLSPYGISRDVSIEGDVLPGVAWNHRSTGQEEIYFFSNQSHESQELKISLRSGAGIPVLINPLQGQEKWRLPFRHKNGERTEIHLNLEGYGSRFVVFVSEEEAALIPEWRDMLDNQSMDIKGPWVVEFDAVRGGPVNPLSTANLFDWSKAEDPAVRNYSGRVRYVTQFDWDPAMGEVVMVSLGEVHNLAKVYLNGEYIGTSWTEPHSLPLSSGLRGGSNDLVIEVFNTWANRLMGDHALPNEERVTFTTAPFRLEATGLLPAGLLGPVQIHYQTEN